MDNDENDIATPPVVYPQKIPIARSSVNDDEHASSQVQNTTPADIAAREPEAWQFSITKLQIVVLVVAIACAGLGAMLKVKFDSDEIAPYILIIAGTAVGMGSMIVISVGRGLYAFWLEWRREREWINEQKNRPPDFPQQ
jgi:hypothetical protein